MPQINLNISINVLKNGFPRWLSGKNKTKQKNPPANAGDTGFIPESGRSIEGGNGNPLQYSCLENSMDRGAWWATVQGIAKSWTRLSDETTTMSSSMVTILLSQLNKGPERLTNLPAVIQPYGG